MDRSAQHNDMPECCERHGLRFPDGQRRCPVHATPDDLDLLEALDRRAPGIGLRRSDAGRFGCAYAWPYGPNIDVNARERMLDWAEAGGLRLSRGSHCLHWLRKGRCGVNLCRGIRSASGDWADHTTAWNHDGKPAVLVCQPYGLRGSESLRELAEINNDPELTVNIHGAGWYGHGTVMVEIFNAAYLDRRRSA